MRLTILTILFYGFFTSAVAQIRFEKGYFVDDENMRTEALIKNTDWKNNPTAFEYKLAEDAETAIADISTVKEFGINAFSKFVRTKVKIDRSGYVRNLSKKREPEWSEEQLFLKVLVEGAISLYSYKDGNLSRYFFSVNDSPIKQLVYKKYQIGDSHFATNTTFHQQLWTIAQCENITLATIKRIDYKEKDLAMYFVKQNECVGNEYVNLSSKKDRDLFNLKIGSGIDYCKLLTDYKRVDFDAKFSYRISLEAEFILSYNKNKWSLLFEPTYQNYHSEKAIPGEYITARYRTIDLPIGVRHYFFLDDHLKLFVNLLYISRYGIDLNSKVDFESNAYDELLTRHNAAIGAGLSFGRFNMELRYYTGREILRFDYRASNFSKSSFIIRYQLF